jgi:hypothetical protein
MRLQRAPLVATRLGIRAARLGTRIATLPARAGIVLTLVTYEELLDMAERSALVEPPDPAPETVMRRRRRRPAA